MNNFQEFIQLCSGSGSKRSGLRGCEQVGFFLGAVLHDGIHGRRPDAPLWIIDDPLKGFLVARIDHQSQISQQIFDLFSLIKRHPTVNPIWDIVPPQKVLEYSGLRVGSIENSNFLIGDVVPVLAFHDRIGDPFAFLIVGNGLDHSDFLTFILRSPYFFLDLIFVLRDNLVGRRYDVAGTPVVLLEFENLSVFEIFLKVENIFDRCTPKSVNTLRVVADDANIFRTSFVFGQFPDNGVL